MPVWDPSQLEKLHYANKQKGEEEEEGVVVVVVEGDPT